jgi:BirA family transcriptional regulator, biotin operon repressor / biotin---[acetyl-CoA-carboxylase] ligase
VRLRSLELPFEVDSTNTRLLQRGPPPDGRGDACYCERQSAGRGRRGRRWLAPFGSGIAFSIGWQFAAMPTALPALSLAAGVAVARALARLGARGIGLKWPNDIWWNDAKVGGILIDLRAEAEGPAFVVVGVGLNVSLTASARSQIEATGVRAACVADACGATPSRNAVAGTMLDELLGLLAAYSSVGFAPYHDEWCALDVLRGRRVALVGGDQPIVGTASGIDADGALRLEVGGTLRRFASGDVSVRPEDASP